LTKHVLGRYSKGRMMIADIKETDFETKVISSPLPIVVDFWAPWCGPCKMALPVLEELAGALKDKISFVKINVDENPKLAEKLGVLSIPTTVLFKEGKEIGRRVGFAGKDGFEELIKKV
jgi:thioredoxin 1